MALTIDKDGRVKNISPPKTLTKKERYILETAPTDTKLLQKAKHTNFNVVYG